MSTPELTTTDTALLLIDLQNGFVDPEGFVARLYGGLTPSLQAAVEPARELLEAARQAAVPVIHTQHVFEPGYSDGGFLMNEIMPKRMPVSDGGPSFDLVTGSWEAEFYPAVAPIDGEYVVQKNRFDAFIGTRLERYLVRNGIKTLVVGGVVTTICVESTVRDAAMRDYRVYLVTDAVGDADEAGHEQGLARLATSFAHPVQAAEVVGSWVRQPVAA